MVKVGLAFSGGGIRSAAFCSGVLRRLLQRKAKVDYMSCVSGGGYTGTAYLDWKYRNDQKDDPKWHQEFFDHMRKRAGYFCNWQNPFNGILDSLVTIALIATVSVVFPAIVWMSYALPVAYVVNFAAGDVLRAREVCPGEVPKPGADPHEGCHLEVGTDAYKRTILFAALLTTGVLSFIVGRATPFGKTFFKFLSTTSLVILALLFMPWAVHDFLEDTPILVQASILVLAGLVWVSFPVFRSQASLVMVIYAYSYIIHLQVYRHAFLGFEYSVYNFNMAVWVSGLVLWVVPFLGSIQQRLMHVFNRWRLQKAFYTRESVGMTGCSGIACGDIAIGCPKYSVEREKSFRALNLADLEDVSPMYISNATVYSWRRCPGDEDSFEIFTLTPREIRRLDSPYDEDVFMDKLEPDNIQLSDAMAISAAALSQRMGKYDADKEVFTDLKIILGVAMGASMLSNPPRKLAANCGFSFVSLLIETLRVLPIVGFPLVYLLGGEEKWVAIGVFSYFGILLPYSIIALFPTGAAKPGILERITRWFLIHVPYIRYVRNMMGTVNEGPSPPPILRISDGGHFENLGILPLLRMRLPKIVTVNGGACESDAAYGDDLIAALELARKKLKCSFSGLDGRDIYEDIRANFVGKKPGQQPRSYRFKVTYYDTDPNDGSEKPVGEGEILFLAPRHPNSGVHTEERVTWNEALRDIDVDLEAGQWGTGPALDGEEADRLTFCCCECCHSLCCSSVSKLCCGTFPLHSTANQFFTPALFSAYHREGYQACVEGQAAEFLL